MLILYAIPGFLALMALEYVAYQKGWGGQGRDYEWRDTLVSISMGIGSLVVKAPLLATVFAFNVFLYKYRFFDLPQGWWVWLALLVCEDFCFYWFHRVRHEVRILWAEHIAHHSSQHYNLSTALRQPWTAIVTGPIFWIPMPLLGFTPEQILLAHSISLIYQYWIHTELVGKMGAFGWVFNTPSHHRVHHGANPIYLDRNHGGILIVWDRLFGTFQAEIDAEPVNFGLTTNIKNFNLFRNVFHEFAATFRDVRKVSAWQHKLGYVFGPPGWSHDGSRKTSKQMRSEQLAGQLESE